MVQEEPEAAPADQSRRRWWMALAGVVTLALALRFAYLRQIAALPFFDRPVGDSAAHLRRAAEIASGAFLPARPFYYCSIFYPYYLAAALALFHGSLFGVCATQVLAGALVVALLAGLARAIYGPAGGLAAGLLGALYGPFAFLEADVLGVVWGQLALALGLLGGLAWASAERRAPGRGAARLVLSGIAFGLAAVERPNLLVIPPLVAAWCAAQTGVRRALAPLLALAVGVAVPIAIVLALNVAGSGRWVPLTTSGGINLSLGYHAGATGTYDEPWERKAPEFSARHTEPEEAMIAMASAETGRPLSPEEASAYWGRKAVEWIRTHPAAAAALTLRKAALMLNGTEVPNHLDYDFIRDRAPALWLMPLGFGAVLPLAVLGLGDSLRRRRNTRPGGAAPAPRPVLPGARAGSLLLLLASAGAMAGVLPFTVADRYRAPMVPALIVAAGGGVGVLIRLYRHPGDRADRRVLALLTASLLAALVTMIPLQRPLRGRDWWMFAQAYKDRGDLPAAAAAYETAVRVEGGNGELLNNLAVVYRALGERDRAIAALREATRAEPGLAYPHKNLGMLFAARGEYDSALVELRAAGRIDPADAQTQGAIGALLAERGEPVAAAAAFVLARRLAPRDRRLMELIRHYDTAPGRGTPPGSLRR